MKKAIKQSVLTSILGLISIALVALSIFLSVMISNTSKTTTQASENRYNLYYNANRFMDGSAYLTNEVRAYSATADQRHYDNYWNEVNNLKNRDEGVAAMKGIGLTNEEEGLINKMSEISNTLIPLEEEAMALAAEDEKEQALAIVYGSYYEEQIAEISKLQIEFLTVLDARTDKELNDLFTDFDGMIIFMVLYLIILAVIQTITVLITRFAVMKPIKAIMEEMVEISKGNISREFKAKENTSEIGMLNHAIIQTKEALNTYVNDISYQLEALANGNLTNEVTIEYVGDFKPIQISITRIINSLNSAIAEIGKSSEQISADSKYLAEGAQKLSTGSMEQSTAVDNLGGDIRNITAQVGNTTQTVSDAKEKADTASDEMNVSNENMRLMIEAMNKISETSEEIKLIVDNVNSIAFQTNLLALNAAVEAARAGSAGRGFGVVAEEVRNLAGKSAQAAETSTQFIEQSVQAVTEGVRIAHSTAESLGKSGAIVDEIAKALDEISEASSHQNMLISQIDNEIEQITGVIVENTATSEESASASEELSMQAQVLKNLVGTFKLRGSHSKYSLPAPSGK